MQRPFIGIIGQTGSGKTFLANNEFVTKEPRVLIAGAGFDEFSCVQAENLSHLVDLLEEKEAFKTNRPFRVCYDFPPEDYSQFWRIALALGNCLAVCEESDRYAEVVYDEDGARMYGGMNDSYYREVVYRGRHYGVGVLLIALSPKAIPTEGRRQLTRLISFRQIFPDDVEWLYKVVGEEAYKLPALAGPPHSPPNPYLDWTPASGARIVQPK
jgi:hypothetical protein